MKRTSTDAGFNHTSDAHDAKMSRSHTPGMMHVRPSTTGATARKGMEDLKSRLVEAPLNVNPRSSLVTHTNATSFSKALPTATGSTFPINHVAATEKLDRDSTTEIRSHPQDIHRDFSAPIELSASSKIQTAHQLTEPINLQSRVATLEPAASSKAQHKDGPRSGQSPETAANFQNKQTSSSNLIVNMLAADEANSKSLTAEARISPLPTGAQYTGLSSPSEVASVLPATKIETKHLAFLKGAIGASTSPPPSTELEKSTRNPPSGTIDHSVGSDHDDPQPRAGTADEEDEDHHEKHSEAEDDASNDDDTYGEPSVEIVSSHAKQILTNSDHEQDSRNQQESNVRRPALLHQLDSWVSFKAGAALASSWTATKPKPDRPELKSLQLAAAAAKKEQDERDRKATLKEERRLLAAEKKQAEEKAKAENERKARMAEVEKKKQEREEALKARTTFKVKVPTNHAPPGSRQASMTGDAAKKRKVENESNRTIDPKKAKAPQAAEPHGRSLLVLKNHPQIHTCLPGRLQAYQARR
ncbi:hypothetical protein PGTUg99_000864 [Puccinia graminis f. sp. tritici]|uniref:Inner centromere protein ARK-binding domain-containing protein n=1 Tax=Puccinia graminis f. sp. tritici TaxID=56615 RepID=A0A5B0R7Y9_PUCGR|nr:hypothetical protein PGTUg99_000864 [Puccinia graminis f. sp. tritici]